MTNTMEQERQVSVSENRIQSQKSEWKTVGAKVRKEELPVLNKQLDRLNYITLGDLVKDLMNGKITRLTDDQQIDIMKTNLQTNGQITGLSAKPYDFYKHVDINDLRRYLEEKYHKRSPSMSRFLPAFWPDGE
jgi:hypothetical protein